MAADSDGVDASASAVPVHDPQLVASVSKNAAAALFRRDDPLRAASSLGLGLLCLVAASDDEDGDGHDKDGHDKDGRASLLRCTALGRCNAWHCTSTRSAATAARHRIVPVMWKVEGSRGHRGIAAPFSRNQNLV